MTVAPRCPRCGENVVKDGACPANKQRYRCLKGCNWRGIAAVGRDEAAAQGIDKTTAKALHVQAKKARRAIYVITAAQNATPIHKAFWASLTLYAKRRKATLLVIPYRYKNPTSMWSAKAEHDDWWAPELAPHLIDIRTVLNPNLILLADIKTQPTASSPLTGFETITGARSAIVGHPKLELATVPTPQSKMAKILTTTGACTKQNYLPSKAGKKGEFHHTFGACVVEIDGKAFHMRQINAVKDGSFIDLDTEYKPDGTTRKVKAAALIMGDTHVDYADPGVTKATFGKGGIVETLQPAELVWHDVIDFQSASHHNRHDPFIQYAKFHSGMDDVEAELDRCYAYIDKHSPAWVKNVIVASNHHEHLARWVKETDPRTTPRNAMFLVRTYLAMLKGSKETEVGSVTIDPFAWWAKEKLKCIARTKFLQRNEAHMVLDVDLGSHGDHGANGARGNIKGFSKIGVKTVTAHTHTPGISGGAYQVGGSIRLGLPYLRGASSWLHAHCAEYENGKRSLLVIVNGDWRLT